MSTLASPGRLILPIIILNCTHVAFNLISLSILMGLGFKVFCLAVQSKVLFSGTQKTKPCCLMALLRDLTVREERKERGKTSCNFYEPSIL